MKRSEQYSMKSKITLGSLFDGVGAFPLAASYFGIKAVWASEILPAAISVTKRHFPDMRHLGDITALNGGEIPPVEVLCFGSPCVGFQLPDPVWASRGNPAYSWKP